MFEGNLGQQKGFIGIAAPYFTNGYCSAEPTKATKEGKCYNKALQETPSGRVQRIVFLSIYKSCEGVGKKKKKTNNMLPN